MGDENGLLQQTYDFFKSNGYEMGSLDQFESALRDPKQSKATYDYFKSEGFDMGSYDEFIGILPKNVPDTPSPQTVQTPDFTNPIDVANKAPQKQFSYVEAPKAPINKQAGKAVLDELQTNYDRKQNAKRLTSTERQAELARTAIQGTQGNIDAAGLQELNNRQLEESLNFSKNLFGEAPESLQRNVAEYLQNLRYLEPDKYQEILSRRAIQQSDFNEADAWSAIGGDGKAGMYGGWTEKEKAKLLAEAQAFRLKQINEDAKVLQARYEEGDRSENTVNQLRDLSEKYDIESEFTTYKDILKLYPEELKKLQKVEERKVVINPTDSFKTKAYKTLKATAGAVQNSLIDGVINVNKTLNRTAQAIERGVGMDTEGQYSPSDANIEALADFTDPMRWSQIDSYNLFDDKGNFRTGGLIPAVAKTVTDMGVLIGGSALLGGGGGGLVASGYAQQFGGFYDNAKEKGLTDNQAFKYAAAQASLQGFLELLAPNQLIRGTLPLGQKSIEGAYELVKKGVGTKELLSYLYKEIGEENAQEYTQMLAEWGTDAAANMALGENKFDVSAPTVEEFFETAVLTTAATTVMGSVAGKAHLKGAEKEAIETLRSRADEFKVWLDQNIQDEKITIQDAQAAYKLVVGQSATETEGVAEGEEEAAVGQADETLTAAQEVLDKDLEDIYAESGEQTILADETPPVEEETSSSTLPIKQRNNIEIIDNEFAKIISLIENEDLRGLLLAEKNILQQGIGEGIDLSASIKELRENPAKYFQRKSDQFNDDAWAVDQGLEGYENLNEDKLKEKAELYKIIAAELYDLQEKGDLTPYSEYEEIQNETTPSKREQETPVGEQTKESQVEEDGQTALGINVPNVQRSEGKGQVSVPFKETKAPLVLKDSKGESIELQEVTDGGITFQVGTSQGGGVKGARPDERMRFNQGRKNQPVTILAGAELIALHRYGTTPSKSGIAKADIQRIEKKYGVSAYEVSEKLKELARKYRDRNRETVIDLRGSNILQPAPVQPSNIEQKKIPKTKLVNTSNLEMGTDKRGKVTFRLKKVPASSEVIAAYYDKINEAGRLDNEIESAYDEGNDTLANELIERKKLLKKEADDVIRGTTMSLNDEVVLGDILNESILNKFPSLANVKVSSEGIDFCSAGVCDLNTNSLRVLTVSDNFERTILHEVGHLIWHTVLNEGQRKALSDNNPVTEHGKNVLNKKESIYQEVYTQEGIHNEEDFAEMFYEYDGNLEKIFKVKNIKETSLSPKTEKITYNKTEYSYTPVQPSNIEQQPIDVFQNKKRYVARPINKPKTDLQEGDTVYYVGKLFNVKSKNEKGNYALTLVGKEDSKPVYGVPPREIEQVVEIVPPDTTPVSSTGNVNFNYIVGGQEPLQEKTTPSPKTIRTPRVKKEIPTFTPEDRVVYKGKEYKVLAQNTKGNYILQDESGKKEYAVKPKDLQLAPPTPLPTATQEQINELDNSLVDVTENVSGGNVYGDGKETLPGFTQPIPPTIPKDSVKANLTKEFTQSEHNPNYYVKDVVAKTTAKNLFVNIQNPALKSLVNSLKPFGDVEVVVGTEFWSKKPFGYMSAGGAYINPNISATGKPAIYIEGKRGENGEVILTNENDIIHEYIHFVTISLITGNPAYQKELETLYNKAKTFAKNYGLDNLYGFTNIYEFVAEAFSDVTFQTLLANTPSDNKIKSITNIFQEFVEFVRKVLNLKPGVRSVLEDLIDITGDYAVVQEVSKKADINSIFESLIQPKEQAQKERAFAAIQKYAEKWKQVYGNDKYREFLASLPASVNKYVEEGLVKAAYNNDVTYLQTEQALQKTEERVAKTEEKLDVETGKYGRKKTSQTTRKLAERDNLSKEEKEQLLKQGITYFAIPNISLKAAAQEFIKGKSLEDAVKAYEEIIGQNILPPEVFVTLGGILYNEMDAVRETIKDPDLKRAYFRRMLRLHKAVGEYVSSYARATQANRMLHNGERVKWAEYGEALADHMNQHLLSIHKPHIKRALDHIKRNVANDVAELINTLPEKQKEQVAFWGWTKQELNKKIEDVKKRIRIKKYGRLSANPFDLIADYMEIGLYRFIQGARTFNEWSKKMKREIKEDDAFIKSLWDSEKTPNGKTLAELSKKDFVQVASKKIGDETLKEYLQEELGINEQSAGIIAEKLNKSYKESLKKKAETVRKRTINNLGTTGKVYKAIGKVLEKNLPINQENLENEFLGEEGVVFSKADYDKIADFQDKINKATEGVLRDKITNQYLNWLSGKMDERFGLQLPFALWYMQILSDPATQAVNAFGSALSTGVETMLASIEVLARSSVQAVNQKEGGKVFADNFAYLYYRMYEGFARGYNEFKEIIVSGTPPQTQGKLELNNNILEIYTWEQFRDKWKRNPDPLKRALLVMGVPFRAVGVGLSGIGLKQVGRLLYATDAFFKRGHESIHQALEVQRSAFRNDVSLTKLKAKIEKGETLTQKEQAYADVMYHRPHFHAAIDQALKEIYDFGLAVVKTEADVEAVQNAVGNDSAVMTQDQYDELFNLIRKTELSDYGEKRGSRLLASAKNAASFGGKQSARVLKLTGGQFNIRDVRKRVYEIYDEYHNNLDPTIVPYASERAAIGTYTNQPRGVLGVVAGALQWASRYLPVLKLIQPFVNTPANVINSSLDYTLIGTLRGIGTIRGEQGWTLTGLSNIATGLDAPTSIDDKMIDGIKTIIKSAMGMGTLAVLAGYFLSPDEDEEEDLMYPKITGTLRNIPYNKMKELKDRGIPELAIRRGEKGNYYYISYKDIPMGNMALAILGGVSDYYRFGRDNADVVSFNELVNRKGEYPGYASDLVRPITEEDRTWLAWYIGYRTAPRIFLETGFLSNMGDFISSLEEKRLDPDKEAGFEKFNKNLAARTLGGTVPLLGSGLVKAVDQAFDPTVYDSKDVAKIMQGVPYVGDIVSRAWGQQAFVRRNARPSLDVWGDEVKKPYNTFTRLTGVSRVITTPQQPHPAAELFEKWGVFKPVIGETTEIKGVAIKNDPDLNYTYRKLVGKTFKKLVEQYYSRFEEKTNRYEFAKLADKNFENVKKWVKDKMNRGETEEMILSQIPTFKSSSGK